MNSGNLKLQGGFWDVLTTVSTSGAPLLCSARTTMRTLAVP